MAYVLAHLSDPHLAPLPKPRWSELVGKRATGYFNWRRKRHLIHDAATLESIVADLKAQKPDHIAVTGDIANIATAAEFRAGRAWLDALGSANDVSFVPGNHDIYVRRASAYAAAQWGSHMRGDDGTNEFPYLRRRGPLALIGLSSGVPTAPLMATGLVGARQLARFADLLGSLKNEDVFRVVMVHHPPVSAAKRHRRLRDADALLCVIAAHGADLLLHGHDHLAMLNWLAGPDGTRVPAIGVPSASAAPGTTRNAAGYNLYAIDGSAGAWRCEMSARGIDAAGNISEQKRMMLA
jgi:3',5'-cyclic AMP phosphodiesterase CpdA